MIPVDSKPVFDVGFNKSGTTSFAHAMNTLGFKCLHEGTTGFRPSPALTRALRERVPLLHYFPEGYRAFTDMQFIRHHFRELDEQYPGSRFVLLWRDIDSWLDSREAHVMRNRRARDAGSYHGAWLDVDREAWRVMYEAHIADVRGYFKGRSDYLELNICSGQGWETLCPFLGVETPGIPFPHKLKRPTP